MPYEWLFSETSAALKRGGRMLFAEPSGHVSEEHFASLIVVKAQEAGFRPKRVLAIRLSRSALLVK